MRKCKKGLSIGRRDAIKLTDDPTDVVFKILLLNPWSLLKLFERLDFSHSQTKHL
jgi:hypothetical protein